MSRTPNLLSIYQSLSALDESDVLVPVDNYPTDWTIDNGTIAVSALEKKYLTHYTLLIRPTNTTDPVVLRLNDVEITDIFNSHTILFHALVKSLTDRVSVVSSIFRSGGNESTYQGATTITDINVYGVTRSAEFTSPEVEGRSTDSVSMAVRISGHNGNTLHMTYPCLINIYGWSANNFVQNGRAQYIPHFYWDIDQQQDPEYTFYKLFDVLTYAADQSLVKYRDIFQYSLPELPVVADGLEDWANSTLVNPLHVTEENLPWLGQFSGNKITNQLLVNNIDIDLFRYWQLSSRNHGINAGSTDSLTAAASLALSGRAQSIDLSVNNRIIVAHKPIRTGIVISDVQRNVWQFNYDGTLDTDAYTNQGTGFDDDIYAVRAQSDGKIVCGGAFTSVDGSTRDYLARLNIDGSIDDDFDAGALFDGEVNDIQILDDGKIIVAGNFTEYLLKVDSSGDPDTTFNTNISGAIDSEVKCIAISPSNGDIIVGGSFGSPSSFIAKFDEDGNEVAAFTANASTVLNGSVLDVDIQSDGKIIAVGQFSKPTRYIARLNIDGTEDTTFSSTIGKTVEPVYLATTSAISDLSYFTGSIDGVAVAYIPPNSRILVKNQELTATITNVVPGHPSTGTVEFTTLSAHGFSVGNYVLINGIVPGAYNQLYEITNVTETTFQVLESTDDAVTEINGTAVARGEQNGIYTLTSNVFTRATDFNQASEILNEPTIFVTDGTTNGGTFWKLIPRSENFTIDETGTNPLQTTYSIDGQINAVAIDGDDKIVIGGQFSIPSNRLARLMEDGDIDSRFNNNIELYNFGSSSINEINSIVVNDSNEVFVCGEFYPEVKKINTDGTLNTAVSTQILNTIVENRSIAVLTTYMNDPWKIHVMTLARETPDTGAPASITAAVRNTPSSGQVQYTTSAAHGFAAGDIVTVRGLSPSEYNGTFSVVSVTTSSPHRIVVANSAPSGSTTDGTGTASRTSDAVLELLEFSRPMGFSISHSSENLFRFTLNSVALGKISKSSLG